MSSDITYCEMCGKPMKKREAKVVYVEGTRLVLCSFAILRFLREL